MEFDNKKVLTVFTKNEVNKGDLGWFSDTPYELKQAVENEEKLSEIESINKDNMAAHVFIKKHRDCLFLYRYFYPAPYEYLQEQWVKENDLKVGDRVKVTREWEFEEGGFKFAYDGSEVGSIHTVVEIYEDCIDTSDFWLPYYAIEKVENSYNEKQKKWVEENNLKVGDKIKIMKSWGHGEEGFFYCTSHNKVGKEFVVNYILDDSIDTGYFRVPYFAIEKVPEEYRKFANAEEFKPYRDCWWRAKSGGSAFDIDSYNDGGVRFLNLSYTYEAFFDAFVNTDTGEPAGIPIQPIENVGTTQVRGKVSEN